MRKVIYLTLIFLAIAEIAFSQSQSAGVKGTMNPQKETISLNFQEEKLIFSVLKIKFSNYGHEHSSSSPDEPASASLEVYEFDLTEVKATNKITFYRGVDQKSDSVEKWKNYQIKLKRVSRDQKKVVLEIQR